MFKINVELMDQLCIKLLGSYIMQMNKTISGIATLLFFTIIYIRRYYANPKMLFKRADGLGSSPNFFATLVYPFREAQYPRWITLDIFSIQLYQALDIKANYRIDLIGGSSFAFIKKIRAVDLK